GAVIAVTSHCSVIVGKEAKSATGAVVSAMTTLWFCVVVLMPSVYVQTTVVEVVIGKIVVVVPVTVPRQLSVAVGRVIVASSHCSVIAGSEAKSATGAVVSAMTTL